MDRRTFLAGSGAVLLGTPLAAEGQQAEKVYRIGFLGSARAIAPQPLVDGLRELGYIEGRNIVIEARGADLKLERLPDLAVELVRLRVDVIVTQTTPAAQAAKQATSTIPIVMATAGDAVGSGLVPSLARPGGNITGLTFLGTELTVKILELLKNAAPNVSRVAVITNQSIPPEIDSIKAIRQAAPTLGIDIQTVEARTPDDLPPALAEITRARANAFMALESALITAPASRKLLLDFAAQHRLPTAFGSRVFATEGALLAYGIDFAALLRRSATYVDKILRGTRPADLPVEQPTKFELVINLKTAKALGLTIPQPLLLRAAEVIQ